MGRSRRGRVETALDKDLMARPDIAPAARGQLRATARAVDRAERAGDVELVARASAVYLSSLTANGLTAGGAPIDTFGQLLAELGGAGASPFDAPNRAP
jgi:hypothetical protein